MKYLSLLKDSLVETLDRKSLVVLLCLCVVLILLCASLGFRELDTAGALSHIVDGFKQVTKSGGRSAPHFSFPVKYTVEGATRDGKEYDFTLRASPVKEFHKSVLTWNALNKGLVKERKDPVEGITGDTVADPGPELESRFLRAQFSNSLIMRSESVAGETVDGARTFRVKLTIPRQVAIEGSHEVSVLFGAWSTRLPVSLAMFLSFIEWFVADWIGGFFGVMLAVIFTAGFIPGMMQKGTLDLVLAKPVHRSGVILTKYFGGLFYVLIPATVLIGGCWLVISLRSGFFNFGFLACILALGAIFAVLYSFSVLMGVMTRSTIATILLTMALWFLSFLVMRGHVMLNLAPEFGISAPPALAVTVDKARLVLPRTSEMGLLGSYYVFKGNMGPEVDAFREVRGSGGDALVPDLLSVTISSVCFITAMLALACWAFSRKDY